MGTKGCFIFILLCILWHSTMTINLEKLKPEVTIVSVFRFVVKFVCKLANESEVRGRLVIIEAKQGADLIISNFKSVLIIIPPWVIKACSRARREHGIYWRL